MKRVPIGQLVDFGEAFLMKRGVPEDCARAVSKTIVETEAFLQSTHGLVQFSALGAALGKTIDPAADAELLKKQGAMAWLDGSRCMGVLAMHRARELAVELAREHGTGFVGVRNAYWIGALGPYIIPVAEEGLLCQVWAQSSTCKDCAPFGGIDPRFSTNPIALAFPTAGDPVVADFSTATMSMSAAGGLIQAGEKADTMRFLDHEGNPSNDPSVMEHGGSMMFMGGDTEGHKGYALSLFNEALAVLSGGSANNPEVEFNQSFSMMVLDPDAFCGADYYAKEMGRFIAHVKSSRPRPGFGKVRLPGERGFSALEDSRLHGIPLPEDKLEMLRKLAGKNGIELGL